MAPNKKKKKLTSNPRRGFSTVSVASRQKVNDTPAISSAPLEDDQKLGTPSQTCDQFKDSSTKIPKTTSLQHLSPEDLEAHLEDAELQGIVDKHGSTVKKNASRISSRLLTEKRTLRLQATRLNVEKWISDVDMNQILDLATEEQPEPKLTYAT